MSDDLDKLVNEKVDQRLRAIEAEKADSDAGLRWFLAILFGGIAYYFASQLGLNGEKLYWIVGLAALAGFIYEIVRFFIFLVIVVVIVRSCT